VATAHRDAFPEAGVLFMTHPRIARANAVGRRVAEELGLDVLDAWQVSLGARYMLRGSTDARHYADNVLDSNIDVLLSGLEARLADGNFSRQGPGLR
jgi:hypothetical protein